MHLTWTLSISIAPPRSVAGVQIRVSRSQGCAWLVAWFSAVPWASPSACLRSGPTEAPAAGRPIERRKACRSNGVDQLIKRIDCRKPADYAE